MSQGSDEAEGGKEILRELVVSGCDAPPILEPPKAALILSLPKDRRRCGLCSLLIVADLRLAVGFAWNNRLDAPLLQKGVDRIGVVAFVSEQFFDARQKTDAFLRHHTVGGVAGGENKNPGPTEFVDDRVDFAVLSAFREPDRLKICPPFPPLAQQWTFTWLASKAARSGTASATATDSNIFCQMPRSLHRANRL